MIELSIVIPVYNEQDVLPLLIDRIDSLIERIMAELGATSREENVVEILFVNDGSTDTTLSILKSQLVKPYYRYISLSRNFGHQAAVSAGLSVARGNAVVVMDADLQDPPELVVEMIQKWKQGYQGVYAVRRRRKGFFIKKIGYKLFYRLNALISDYTIQENSGDFYLLDRQIIEIINKLPEKSKYIRGLRAWAGFKQVNLDYGREERKSGRAKYTYSKLAKLALQGIVSTSVKPLYLSGFFTVITMLIIIILVIYALLSKIYTPQNVMPVGWTSLMVCILFMGFVQVSSICLLSLYVARIFKEILSRPAYIIAHDSLHNESTKE